MCTCDGGVIVMCCTCDGSVVVMCTCDGVIFQVIVVCRHVETTYVSVRDKNNN